jgi:hypothetical protein
MVKILKEAFIISFEFQLGTFVAYQVICLYVRVYVRAYLSMYVCRCVRSYVCAYVCIYICIYIYIRTVSMLIFILCYSSHLSTLFVTCITDHVNVARDSFMNER